MATGARFDPGPRFTSAQMYEQLEHEAAKPLPIVFGPAVRPAKPPKQRKSKPKMSNTVTLQQVLETIVQQAEHGEVEIRSSNTLVAPPKSKIFAVDDDGQRHFHPTNEITHTITIRINQPE